MFLTFFIWTNILLTDTSQIRTDGPPHSHTAFPEALADGKLQQQERHSLQHQQDQIGHQKGTWKMYSVFTFCMVYYVIDFILIKLSFFPFTLCSITHDKVEIFLKLKVFTVFLGKPSQALHIWICSLYPIVHDRCSDCMGCICELPPLGLSTSVVLG